METKIITMRQQKRYITNIIDLFLVFVFYRFPAGLITTHQKHVHTLFDTLFLLLILLQQTPLHSNFGNCPIIQFYSETLTFFPTFGYWSTASVATHGPINWEILMWQFMFYHQLFYSPMAKYRHCSSCIVVWDILMTAKHTYTHTHTRTLFVPTDW